IPTAQRLSVDGAGTFSMFPSRTGTAAFTVNQGGNVGIGTTSPGAKLNVNGQAAIGSGGSPQSWGFDLYANAANPTAFIDAYANPGTASLILQGRGVTPNNHKLSVNSGGLFAISPSSTNAAAIAVNQ